MLTTIWLCATLRKCQIRTTERMAISSVWHNRQVRVRTLSRTLAIRNARWHIGYGHPQDRVTQKVAGWASGPQNLWQLHRISGSKSRSASEGSSKVVTAPKAKVKVETHGGGARGRCARGEAAMRPRQAAVSAEVSRQ